MIYTKIDTVINNGEELKEGLNQVVMNSGDVKSDICRLDWRMQLNNEGWRRAVYLDMTDPNTNCPSGWQLTGYSKRTCGRIGNFMGNCDSVKFSVSGGQYSHVSGTIKAYAWGVPQGFFSISTGFNPLESSYFSGVAVMHGSPREHIWTFVAGSVENNANIDGACPCDNGYSSPSWLGSAYVCESGYTWTTNADFLQNRYTLHADDPLWDGQGCYSTSTCCALNDPPYFTATLSSPTTDNLELVMCNFDNKSKQDIAVERIELYVK